MKILAVETSTEYCSVALLENDSLIEEINDNTPFSHNKKVFSIINDILMKNKMILDDIDLFAVGAGPGSFTGLRIGTSVIKALSYATETNSISIDTMDILALEAIETIDNSFKDSDIKIKVFLDGKQKDFFSAEYIVDEKDSNETIKRISDIKLSKFIESAEDENLFSKVNIANFEKEKLSTNKENSSFITTFPKAKYLGKLAFYNKENINTKFEYEPNYYKDFKINKSKKRIFL